VAAVSRENAVSALLGTGIKCAITKSFTFIYARNQPNLGLLGIIISDPKFYEVAVDAADISIDLAERKIKVGGGEWDFELSQMEKRAY
jgi:3-isopropylmalate dehydratase small subunit